MEELHLTDLIDIDMLQQIQDAFSMMTGIAAITTDANGVPVTKGSRFSEFCAKYTRCSPVGAERCKKCDRYGADLALEKGSSVAYYCHAGLMDFASPIMANGQLVGCFIGGQVLTKPADPAKILKVAKEIDVEPISYLKAVEKVNIVPEKDICNAADFLYQLANILSNITYHKYQILQANIEIEKANRMKSDFLANMSHEIRTPMNAVIGMAEMALREELPPSARDYITQIKGSGRTLLTIINDILDFSKIESGKMDITASEYAPLSIINDIANIITTRIGDKKVELLLDISPDLPYELIGDSTRLKQILVNLSNNAVKFTREGQVILRMKHTEISETEVMLHVSVEDTGIGIKKEDIGKLFQSFQQLDSKRNRNIEGTGLGLAISKHLLNLMGGDIHVESQYGRGSIFTFSLPQTISVARPSLTVTDAASTKAAVLISNPYVKLQMKRDITRLGVEYMSIDSIEDIPQILEQGANYLFIEDSLFSKRAAELIEARPQIKAILMIPFHSAAKSFIPNLAVVKKPLYCLNLAAIFNHEDLYMPGNDTMEDFDFIAPTAEVLIVDDNAVNLTVADGLLEPLKMHIETALSGQEAIDKISSKRYDLIFMDHMMPELDGVETTHIIRRFHPEYDDVPIIALTANAVDGTRDMFLSEGMNDFVAKPIEMRIITSKIKRWLPPEKIQKLREKRSIPESPVMSDISIEGIDIHTALTLLGSEKLFWSVLKDYFGMIRKKAQKIKEMVEAEDWTGYTIEVHALKSTSRQIGALQLSELAAALEQAGHAKDEETIHRRTDELLSQYLHYYDILLPYFAEEQEKGTGELPITAEKLTSFFADMRAAMDELDMDAMETVIKEMAQYAYEGQAKDLFEQLRQAAEGLDVEACEKILSSWESI